MLYPLSYVGAHRTCNCTPSRSPPMLDAEPRSRWRNGPFVPPADEQLVSQEFQKWYRHLIKCGANSLVYQLNESMERIRLVLPTFASAWERAVSSTASRETAGGPPG